MNHVFFPLMPLFAVLLGTAMPVRAAGEDDRYDFIAAVKAGNVDKAAALLARGVPVDSDNRDYTTPRTAITLAAESGNDAMVDLLLRLGADPNTRNDFPYRFNLHGTSPSRYPENRKTALMYAAEAGNAAVVRRLLRAGAKPNAETGYEETALMFAAAAGRTEAVRALIEGGADIEAIATDEQNIEVRYRDYGGTALSYALRYAWRARAKAQGKRCTSYLETADVLVAAYARTKKPVGDAKRVVGSALSCADTGFLSRVIALGPVKEARDVLLYLGTDLDDNAEAVKLLVQAGADVNARTAKPWDDSPLMRAAMTGSVRTLGVLLDAGAEINAATTHGETALWHAARQKHAQAVAMLLERGANPNLLTQPSPQWFSNGGTALHVAVEKECLECARLLLARGADPKIPDASGKTPLESLRKAGLVK